ncbi:MAG: hypothetical protein PSV46_15195 [Reyranella sp.]|nr:hypothetical protein [Reyranella sp.]
MKRIVSRDLSDENDVLRLPHTAELGCTLAGGCVLSNHSSHNAQEMLLDSLVLQVQGLTPGIRHWLMSGHDVWQPDNRIVKHNKLWKSLAKRVPLPSGIKSEEFLVESAEGLKYFGFIECQGLVASELVSVLRTERACTLIASWGDDPTDELKSIARQGWTRPTIIPPLEILKIACRKNVIVYALLGDFDDQERGSAIIAQPQWIEAVFYDS